MKSLIKSIAATGLLAALGLAQSSNSGYSVVDLGPVGGAPGGPNAIANNGLIAGAAVGADNKSRATAWFMGLRFDLGTPGLGGPNSFANGINDKGQAVGAAQTTVPNGEDFCGFSANGDAASPTTCLPFVFQNGVMTKLPTLGGANGVAAKINNQGQAVGFAETTGRDPNPACRVTQFSPVLWGKSGVTQLPTFPGDPDGAAADINESGQVVGATGSCADYDPNSGYYLLERHAMLWESGMAINLGNLGGTGTFGGIHACALNNRGQVVGHSDLPGDETFHSFLWTWETGMRDLGVLPGDMASTANSINDQGTAVGGSFDASFNARAFVVKNGVLTDLNSVVTSNPGKLYMLVAFWINARGEIVGLAVTPEGDLRGFLATPDASANISPHFETTTRPGPLSELGRRMIFRHTGIRRR